jgi:hypothetical protein
LFLLRTGQQHDPRAWLTIAALVCGIALTLVFWYAVLAGGPGGGTVAIVYLPLACTAHLVYLARGILFTRPAPMS